MNRLTKKEIQLNSMFPYQLLDEEISTKLDAIHKLGQLEDLEEELGIDLITLFKALMNGIWVKNDFGQIEHIYVILYNLDITQNDRLNYCFSTFDNTFILFASQGKVWALTKEELQYE